MPRRIVPIGSRTVAVLLPYFVASAHGEAPSPARMRAPQMVRKLMKPYDLSVLAVVKKTLFEAQRGSGACK